MTDEKLSPELVMLRDTAYQAGALHMRNAIARRLLAEGKLHSAQIAADVDIPAFPKKKETVDGN